MAQVGAIFALSSSLVVWLLNIFAEVMCLQHWFGVVVRHALHRLLQLGFLGIIFSGFSGFPVAMGFRFVAEKAGSISAVLSFRGVVLATGYSLWWNCFSRTFILSSSSLGDEQIFLALRNSL